MDFQWQIKVNNNRPVRRFFEIKKGESIDHVALKLLGFILFFDYNPAVEKSMNWKYKPDLVAFDRQGKVNLWVECEDVSVRKVHRILGKYKSAGVIILKLTGHEAEQFSSIFKTGDSYPENLSFVGFEDDFINKVCEGLKDRILIKAKFDGKMLSLSWDNFGVRTRVYRFGGTKKLWE